MFKSYMEDKYFWYLRKDRGLATSYGKEKCFLEYFAEQKNNVFAEIFAYQREMFWNTSEYGLVNRLDNNTGGLLYFAKAPIFLERYKVLQKERMLQKIYLADVSGQRIPEKVWQQAEVAQNGEKIIISRKLWHHKHQENHMVVVQDEKIIEKYAQKIRWEFIFADTEVVVLYYDVEKNISSLLVCIKKGVHHQIRAHLASLGYPILGDKIYWKNKKNTELHLWSVGLSSL